MGQGVGQSRVIISHSQQSVIMGEWVTLFIVPQLGSGYGFVSGTLNSDSLNSGTLNSGTLNSNTSNKGTLNSGTLNCGTFKTGTLNGGTLRSGTLDREWWYFGQGMVVL